MSNIHRISFDTLALDFHNPQERFGAWRESFFQTDLGKIYRAIPWLELIGVFGLKRPRCGPAGTFGPQGKLALMFLKSYSQLSDRKLIEQLNGNLHWQIFCGIYIPPDSPIRDFKVVSKIRCELAAILGKCTHGVQKALARHWKPYMSQTTVMLTDATCYESSVRYPTSAKILWESVEWMYRELVDACGVLGIRRPRTKYLKWERRYGQYSRKRKRRRKERRSLIRGLLRLLAKLLAEMDRIIQAHNWQPLPRHRGRREVIDRVLEQQQMWFFDQQKPKGIIVSLAKPYLRPIIRGKEIKPVEFGAKVNKIQVDGITFIETLSFDAFNEGTKLRNSIFLSRRLFGRIDAVGADSIYATNKNRRYCTGKQITTDFKRKGRAGRYEAHRKQLARNITRERATRLEGSFGNEKNHFLLHRIKAMTKQTEALWIFFGIHTANALNIGRRIAAQNHRKAA